MKKIAVLIIPVSLFLIISPIGSALESPVDENNLVIPEDLSKKIIIDIRSKYIPMYEKYAGIESERQAYTETYDSKTNTLIGTGKVHSVRKDYFYKEPEVTVLKYFKDGKEEHPSKLRQFKTDPGKPVFDKDGEKHYEALITGYKTIGNTKCYEVKVTPKEITPEHFVGFIYVTVADLNIIKTVGTSAKLRFPLKELRMDFEFSQKDELIVLTSAVIESKVDIPVILPDRHFVTKIKVLNSKAILNE